MGNLFIRRLGAALVAALFCACQSGEGSAIAPLAPVETSAATLISASPASGESNVSLGAQVSALLSEAVDPKTVTTATFTLFLGGNQIAGSVSASGANVVFIPEEKLKSGTSYKASLTKEVHDLEGKPLAQDFTWTFATQDTISPYVTSVAPDVSATLVPTASFVDVNFSEPIATSSNWPAVLTLLGPGGNPVPSTTLLAGASRLTLTPLAPLSESTTFTVLLLGSMIADLSGNPLLGGDQSWSFTTTETVPPTVLSVDPPNGTVGVSQFAAVTAVFSEPLDPTTVDISSFLIVGPSGQEAGAVSYDPATLSATFQVAGKLQPVISYQATLKAKITDVAGNPLAADYSWNFTTSFSILGTAELVEFEDTGDAEQPQLAADGLGNFIAVWLQSDATNKNMWANRYTPGGGWGTPVLLDTLNAVVSDPRLDVNAAGNAFALWVQNKVVYASQFDAATAQWSAPVAISVAVTNARPDISIASNGDALAAWQQKQGNTKANIMANFYDSATGSWLGESLVEADNTGDADLPDALLGNGTAYVIWQQTVTAAGGGDGKVSIYASSISVSPAPTAPLVWPAPLPVEQNGDGNASSPVIALDANGDLIAAWDQKVDVVNAGNGVADDFNSIYANKFAAGVWGTPELLENDDTGVAGNVRLAADASGSLMALWEQKGGSVGVVNSIYSRSYDGALGQWVVAAPEAAAMPGPFSDTREHWLAGGAAGSFRAVWGQKDSAGVWSAFVNQWGSISGWGTPAPIEAEQSSGAQTPRVIDDGQGNPMTIWVQSTPATSSKKSVFANALK